MDSMVEENGGNSSIDPLSGPVGNGTGEHIQEHIPEGTLSLNYYSLQTIIILAVDQDNNNKTTVPSSPQTS